MFRSAASKSRAKSAHEGKGTDKATSIVAIRTIAQRLGLDTLHPEQYEQEAQALINSARGRRREALRERFPTAGQIQRFGPWDELLIEAGLQLRPSQPRASTAGEFLPEAIEWFLRVQGWLPNQSDLVRFAREHEFSLPSFVRGPVLDDAYKRVRQRRSEAGLWTPPQTFQTTSPRQKPPWVQPKQQSEPRHSNAPTKRRLNHWTFDLVREGLRLAAGQLEAGEKLNQITVRRLAKADGRIPSPSIIGVVAKQHGTTFSQLRDEALMAPRA